MEIEVINYVSEIMIYMSELKTAKVIGIDTETTGLDPHLNDIRLIQLAIEDLPVLVIDCKTFLPEGLNIIKEIIESGSIKVFQNGKFDMKFFMSLGIKTPHALFDTMIAARLLRGSGGPYRVGLNYIVDHYLNENLSKEEQVSDWSKKLTDKQIKYAAKDAEVLIRLRKILIDQLKKNRLIEVARQEFACTRAMAHVEYYGIKLDEDKWFKLRLKVIEERDKSLNHLYEYTERPLVQIGIFEDITLNEINMDSNKQMLKLLNKNGIPVKSTSKHALASYTHIPLVYHLTEYRKATKLLSMFLYSIPNQINPATDRLHPRYSQIGAWSGRMSCGGPNIQQIPREKRFRECFVAEKGRKLVIADYSQIELRVVAELTKDKRMIESYRNGEDLHRLTAALVSGKDISEVTKEERQAAKAMNFGLVFAMGAMGLKIYAEETYNVHMTIEEAEEFRNRFFRAYSGVALWHRNIKKNPPKESRTVSGRKHVYKNPGLSGLCNTPVQGSAADIVKNALGRLVEKLEGTNIKIIAVIHDEIVLETDSNKANETAKLLKETMEDAGAEYLKLVPLLAEAQITDSWAEK